MSAPVLVYCLQMQFFWNAQPLTAGRLPIYGTEVANVSYQRGHEPAETVLYRLDPEPIAYLAGKSIDVWFAEPLPAKPGMLGVRAQLVPCADRKLAADARLRTPAAQREWQAELRAEPGLTKPRKGRLSVGHPFTATVELAPAGGEERFDLALAGRRGAGPTIEVSWNRHANPGHPRIVFVPAHRPFDRPVVRLRPRGRSGDPDPDPDESW